MQQKLLDCHPEYVVTKELKMLTLPGTCSLIIFEVLTEVALLLEGAVITSVLKDFGGMCLVDAYTYSIASLTTWKVKGC